MRKLKAIVIVFILINTTSIHAQKKQDSIKVIEIASLYSQGWYKGDSLIMSKVLHPELVKRNVQNYSDTGNDIVNNLSYNTMIQYTIAGYGKHTPKEKQNDMIKVLDICENIASLRVESSEYVEYLQLVKYNGEWKVLNVLWQMKTLKNFD